MANIKLPVTSPFAIGDRVRCMNAEGTGGRLWKGELYTVTDVIPSNISTGMGTPMIRLNEKENKWKVGRFIHFQRNYLMPDERDYLKAITEKEDDYDSCR